ncbi:MAG: ATPase, T2SS/T4P/T4SS family, partial [Patescibacteria group bacterium]
HLVFSTLHTNDAASTILRLIDMKLSPSIIAPAVNLMLSQRLVRKVCAQCSFKKETTAEELKKFKAVFADMPIRVPVPPFDERAQIPRVKGCKLCNNTGYKGRMGVFELLQIDDEAEKVIVAKPTQAQLAEMAKRGGMVSMKQDGFLKVLSGITTIEEIESIVG